MGGEERAVVLGAVGWRGENSFFPNSSDRFGINSVKFFCLSELLRKVTARLAVNAKVLFQQLLGFELVTLIPHVLTVGNLLVLTDGTYTGGMCTRLGLQSGGEETVGKARD